MQKKNILIIYPHWPPSNLAGVHRARLISNFLPQYGWHPIILTVDEQFYEETLDYDICKTVRSTTEVIKVSAMPVKKASRFIGDISLRAFSQLKKKAISIIQDQTIDFVWVPIPSFYTAIIARQVFNATKLPYGIDYIDPWVDSFVGQEKVLSKAWISNQIARLMEPYSVKRASLISGVATAYYQGVLDRNFRKKEIKHVGMPYGFDPEDHDITIDNLQLPWSDEIEAYVYAGAFLPKSHEFLKELFRNIGELKSAGLWDDRKKLYFLGTGHYPGKQIITYAEEYGISDSVVEMNQRFPFLHILNFLSAAKGIMVLGSTEQHYTASKIFQSLLSGRPVFGVFHHLSSAAKIMLDCSAGQYLVKYEGEIDASFKTDFCTKVKSYFLKDEFWSPDLNEIEQYSAKKSAEKLVLKIQEIVN